MAVAGPDRGIRPARRSGRSQDGDARHARAGDGLRELPDTRGCKAAEGRLLRGEEQELPLRSFHNGQWQDRRGDEMHRRGHGADDGDAGQLQPGRLPDADEHEGRRRRRPARRNDDDHAGRRETHRRVRRRQGLTGITGSKHMRTIILGAAAAALLAACSGDTAQEAKKKEARAEALQPGEYEVTDKVDEVRSTDNSTPATAMKAAAAGETVPTSRICVAADGAIDPKIFAEAGDK